MMTSEAFVRELESSNQRLLAKLGDLGGMTNGTASPQESHTSLLRIALANEISVAELAAAWMPVVTEWDIKVALARQVGDEARHFHLVANRLERMGVSMDDYANPPENKLFAYLRGLSTPEEKIAAGMFTLESIAYRVNESFLRYCQTTGDQETAEIYQRHIQPDELHHHQLGRGLLEKYANKPEAQFRAREAATRTLELALELRTALAQKIGTGCFPGC